MRKLLLTTAAALVLVLPALAAAHSLGLSDGTLAVRDGVGKVRVTAVGGLIGRLDRGKVTLVDPVDGDGTRPIVSGCEFAKFRDLDSGGTLAVCKGTKLRFRLVGGRFTMIVTGTGIDLSVVGHGNVLLSGQGDDDGKYSLNGEDFRSLPNEAESFPLSAPPELP